MGNGAGGSGHAPVVVVGDYLVAIHELDGLETIECLQPETGKRYWKYDYPIQLGSITGSGMLLSWACYRWRPCIYGWGTGAICSA